MTHPFRGRAAIVGIGEVPTGKFPDRLALESALESAREAILDAGIPKTEIDAVISIGAIFSRRYNTDLIFSVLCEELGLLGSARDNLQVMAGGASSSASLKTAAGLVIAGLARAVLVVHSEKLGTGLPPQDGIDLFSTLGISEEWETPFGLHFSAVAGLTTQRYMHETGTTAEQLASVCVSNRKWAELNPNAMFRKPLSVDEVLSSKMLSTPLHAKESNMLADGGSAYIVTSAERARGLTRTPVYVLGTGSRVTHYSLTQDADLSRFGYAEAGREAFEMAGVRPDEIDIAEIYDSYPVFQLIALEETGLMRRGEAGALVAAGHTWPGGRLPMTTNGGMLSQGHTGAGGGVAVLVEAARQLMGKAGERQVPDARLAMETATGGTYMDSHVTILGTERP
jgi:acetyl-CoA acetyltransferase